jgi:hypothetical protein
VVEALAWQAGFSAFCVRRSAFDVQRLMLGNAQCVTFSVQRLTLGNVQRLTFSIQR